MQKPFTAIVPPSLKATSETYRYMSRAAADISGNQRAIDGTDRDAGNPVGMNVCLG